MSIEDGIIKEHVPKISENDRLTFAVFLAIVFHAMILLGIAFSIPKQNTTPSTPIMQVVMAQYHSLPARCARPTPSSPSRYMMSLESVTCTIPISV